MHAVAIGPVAGAAEEASLARARRLLWVVAALTFGAILSLRHSVCWLLYSAPGWAVVAVLGPRLLHAGRSAATRLCAVGACAWTVTLLLVLVVALPGPDVGRAVHAHPAFGEHAVLVRAGFPWPGIEGNGLGHAMDCVPFTMGVDALLVNFTCLSLAVAWLWRRVPPAELGTRIRPWAFAAVAATVFAGLRTLVWFD
ncbi:MAG: hypothetical protein FJ265_08160 [Planctomycetes bacterium]|nr:hypothetical protein [Planctomycetota bacterium]